MHDALALYRERGPAALWERTLGYMDYSMEQAMELQRRLLLERLSTLPTSEVGRRIAGDRVITSIDEFRERVPFTTYADYEELLGQRREDVLEHKPITRSARCLSTCSATPTGSTSAPRRSWCRHLPASPGSCVLSVAARASRSGASTRWCPHPAAAPAPRPAAPPGRNHGDRSRRGESAGNGLAP